MGRRSRTKGATWERELAARWRDSGLYPDARRGIGQARCASEVPDVDGTPWWVECKHQQRPNVLAAMEQAEDATDGRPVLAVVKRDRRPPVVCLSLDAFEALVRNAAARAPIQGAWSPPGSPSTPPPPITSSSASTAGSTSTSSATRPSS